MALTGYKKTCGKQTGGVRSLFLIEKDNIKALTIEAAKKAYSAIVLVAAAAFAKYDFKEDEAEFKETTKAENGSIMVTQEISFVLPKMGEASRIAVEEIADISPCGLVGVVVDNMGNARVVGFNEEQKDSRPLRLSQAEGTTGKALSDVSAETVTLTCNTTEKAYLFTGDTDALTTPAVESGS